MNELHFDVLDIALALLGYAWLVLQGLVLGFAWYRSASQPDNSISVQVARWGQKYPVRFWIHGAVSGLVVGLLLGHWFWPVHLG